MIMGIRNSIGCAPSLCINVELEKPKLLKKPKKIAWKLDKSRSPFQDLMLIAGSAGVLLMLVFLEQQGFNLNSLRWFQVPLGLIHVLFVPGYCLTVIVFPQSDDIDGLTRVALSIGLSVSMLPPLAVLLNMLPGGITIWPMARFLNLWIICLSVVGMLRRRSLVTLGIAYIPPVFLPPLTWQGVTWLKRLCFIASVALIGGGIVLGTSLLLLPPLMLHLTEFYLLGSAGMAQDYPRSAKVGEEIKVNAEIINREQGPRTYHVEVWVTDTWNNYRRECLLVSAPITTTAGSTKEVPLTWKIPWSGENQKVEILLFMKPKPQPYRRTVLWINVAEE